MSLKPTAWFRCFGVEVKRPKGVRLQSDVRCARPALFRLLSRTGDRVQFHLWMDTKARKRVTTLPRGIRATCMRDGSLILRTSSFASDLHWNSTHSTNLNRRMHGPDQKLARTPRPRFSNELQINPLWRIKRKNCAFEAKKKIRRWASAPSTGKLHKKGTFWTHLRST